RGTNFSTGLTFNAGADIVVSSISIVSSTQATIVVQVGSNAALGPRDVAVTTPGGTSNVLVFTVLVPPPTLTSISPVSGTQQSTANITLTGTNFVSALTVQASGLTVSQVAIVSTTEATAVLTIPVSTVTGNYGI